MERPEGSGETRRFPDVSDHANAFFRTLARHVDAPVTKTDLVEEHPGIDWTGQVNPAWQELQRVEALSGRLFAFGDGSNRAYALTSHTDDIDLIVARLQYIADYSHKTGAPEREEKMWRKRVAAASAVAGALAAGTVAVVRYRRKHR